MGLDLSVGEKFEEAVKERVHDFQINTPQGVGQIRIPHGAMRCCPCGCDRFKIEYHVTWAKPPVLGAAPIQLRVEVFVCSKCGDELLPTHPTVASKKLVTE